MRMRLLPATPTYFSNLFYMDYTPEAMAKWVEDFGTEAEIEEKKHNRKRRFDSYGAFK